MSLPELPPELIAEGFRVGGIDELDQSELISFIDEILADDCMMDAHSRLERSIAKFFDDFTQGRRFCISVMQDGKLCGFTAVDRYNDTTATLKWIFVDSDHRGRGVGAWLLDHALSFARSANYEKIILCTATQMEAALALYRSRGFEFKQRVTFWQRPMQVYENVLSERVSAAT